MWCDASAAGRDRSIKRPLLLLLALPLLSSVLAMACTQPITPGPTPVPRSNPDIDATVSAAVAATLSAASGTPIPTATPDTQALGPQVTEAARVQATVTALLATPPVPVLSASSVTPNSPLPTPLPSSAPLPTATLMPTRAPALALPKPLPAPTATPQVVTPPTPTATVQPTPTVTRDGGCQIAPNGTLVTAWIDGGVFASAQVANGSYNLFVEQPEGESFSGKTVTFKIGDIDANESAIWAQGGGDELNLTAAAGSVPVASIPSASPGPQHHRGGLLAQPLPPHIFLGTVTICGVS